jgi:hypothetical protein
MGDEQLNGAATDALALVLSSDHEPPEEVVVWLPRLRAKVLVVKHEKAHRSPVLDYRAKPCLRMEVGLGDREGVAGDEPLLRAMNFEVNNLSEVVLSDLGKLYARSRLRSLFRLPNGSGAQLRAARVPP